MNLPLTRQVKKSYVWDKVVELVKVRVLNLARRQAGWRDVVLGRTSSHVDGFHFLFDRI